MFTRDRHGGSRWRRTAALTGTMLLLATTPALAKGGPNASSGDGGSTTPVACADFSARDTATLDEVATSTTVADLHREGLTGAGVDVAVVDTGIAPVPGLEDHVDLLDVSFDSEVDGLRHNDLYGHGTSMASIVDGIAPGARLLDVKVGAGDGSVDVSQVIAAIDFVVEHRTADGMDIRVLQLAYGTDAVTDWQTDPLTHAVQRAWDAGVVVVAAAGNDGRGVATLANPATNPYVLAVGASSATNGGKIQVPSWASTGDGVRNPDVLAPGEGVLGAGVPGSFLATQNPEATCLDGDRLMLRGSGTSQASAVAAGAVALLLEDRPELTPDQVKHLLTSTAFDLGANEKQQGHGHISVVWAKYAATPGAQAVQSFGESYGSGSLDAARGSYHVGNDTDGYLTGEVTAFATDWEPYTLVDEVCETTTILDPVLSQLYGVAVYTVTETCTTDVTTDGDRWTDVSFDRDGTLATGTWSGATWAGATWAGATWAGATWAGATWAGATWAGATWAGATWAGATWAGATWAGATWAGATWASNGWLGSSWS